jgi:hypothetical protein
MMLLNFIGHLLGILFIEKYNKCEFGSFYFFGALFLISIYAVFQIFVFSVHKKYSVYIIPIITLVLISFLIYNDPLEHGGEVLHTIVCVVSRIISELRKW